MILQLFAQLGILRVYAVAKKKKNERLHVGSMSSRAKAL